MHVEVNSMKTRGKIYIKETTSEKDKTEDD